MDCESGNGRGRKSTVFNTLKIAVLAPMPSVRTASADTVKPGFFRRTRSEYRSDGKRALIRDASSPLLVHAVRQGKILPVNKFPASAFQKLSEIGKTSSQ